MVLNLEYLFITRWNSDYAYRLHSYWMHCNSLYSHRCFLDLIEDYTLGCNYMALENCQEGYPFFSNYDVSSMRLSYWQRFEIWRSNAAGFDIIEETTYLLRERE